MASRETPVPSKELLLSVGRLARFKPILSVLTQPHLPLTSYTLKSQMGNLRSDAASVPDPYARTLYSCHSIIIAQVTPRAKFDPG